MEIKIIKKHHIFNAKSQTGRIQQITSFIEIQGSSYCGFTVWMSDVLLGECFNTRYECCQFINQYCRDNDISIDEVDLSRWNSYVAKERAAEQMRRTTVKQCA